MWVVESTKILLNCNRRPAKDVEPAIASTPAVRARGAIRALGLCLGGNV